MIKLPTLTPLYCIGRCGALIEMYPTAVAASVSYFRSQNAMLRRNVVVLLAAVLAYTQTAAGGPDTELVPEERVAEVVAGVVELLRDQDRDVRKVAAEHLGKILLTVDKN